MSVCQFDKVTLADKVTLFATLLSVYQLDKVSFFTLIRQKSVTCSDNAPTVALDKVPGNRRLLKAAMWGMLVIIWIYQAYIQGNNAICPYTSEILHIGRETFF
mgnify:CR=1 FL=1